LLGTTYQSGKKYTKFPQNVPNGHKIYIPFSRQIDKMAIKKHQHRPLQDLPKFTQNGIFALKMPTLLKPARVTR
jgi:hypothetical protein